jgi:hypothetical protein
MMGVRGQVQREGEVIHVIAQRLDDLSGMLASVGRRADVADIYRVSRADVVKNPMSPDPRDPAQRPLGTCDARPTSTSPICGSARESSPANRPRVSRSGRADFHDGGPAVL